MTHKHAYEMFRAFEGLLQEHPWYGADCDLHELLDLALLQYREREQQARNHSRNLATTIGRISRLNRIDEETETLRKIDEETEPNEDTLADREKVEIENFTDPFEEAKADEAMRRIEEWENRRFLEGR